MLKQLKQLDSIINGIHDLTLKGQIEDALMEFVKELPENATAQLKAELKEYVENSIDQNQ